MAVFLAMQRVPLDLGARGLRLRAQQHERPHALVGVLLAVAVVRQPHALLALWAFACEAGGDGRGPWHGVTAWNMPLQWLILHSIYVPIHSIFFCTRPCFSTKMKCMCFWGSGIVDCGGGGWGLKVQDGTSTPAVVVVKNGYL